MRTTSTIATVAATALLSLLGLAGCRQVDRQAQRTASATVPGEAARPAQGTSNGWTARTTPPVATYDNGSTPVDPRERDLAQREAALAQREQAVALREAQAGIAPQVIGPEPVTPPAAAQPASTQAKAPQLPRNGRAHAAPKRAPAPATPAPDAASTEQADATGEQPVPGPAPEIPARPDHVYTNVTVPAGTAVTAEVTRGVSSADAQVGDEVEARVAQDVYAGDQVAIPAGAIVHGTVVDLHGLGRVGGQSRLAVRFDRIELPEGDSVPIDATWSAMGKNETPRAAATVGASTIGGAILGRILSGGHSRGGGTAAGAAAGAVIGSLLASHAHGEQVSLPAGATVDLALDGSVRVTVRE